MTSAATCKSFNTAPRPLPRDLSNQALSTFTKCSRAFAGIFSHKVSKEIPLSRRSSDASSSYPFGVYDIPAAQDVPPPTLGRDASSRTNQSLGGSRRTLLIRSEPHRWCRLIEHTDAPPSRQLSLLSCRLSSSKQSTTCCGFCKGKHLRIA